MQIFTFDGSILGAGMTRGSCVRDDPRTLCQMVVSVAAWMGMCSYLLIEIEETALLQETFEQKRLREAVPLSGRKDKIHCVMPCRTEV